MLYMYGKLISFPTKWLFQNLNFWNFITHLFDLKLYLIFPWKSWLVFKCQLWACGIIFCFLQYSERSQNSELIKGITCLDSPKETGVISVWKKLLWKFTKVTAWKSTKTSRGVGGVGGTSIERIMLHMYSLIYLQLEVLGVQCTGKYCLAWQFSFSFALHPPTTHQLRSYLFWVFYWSNFQSLLNSIEWVERKFIFAAL